MSESIKRIYVDSTVVSGMFDYHMPERIEQARRFWDAMQRGDFRIVASDVLKNEVGDAPIWIREFFNNLPTSQIDTEESTDESDDLALQYVGAKVISEKHMNDCRHIALATITQADAVVSWNCDDMVNPNRIPKYNEVNKQQGYPVIEILTPDQFMEVHYDEN